MWRNLPGLWQDAVGRDDWLQKVLLGFAGGMMVLIGVALAFMVILWVLVLTR